MINTELLNKGFKLAIEKNFDEANIIFDELIKDNPKDVSLLGMLSNLFIKTKQEEKAKDCLRKICDIKEDFSTLSTLGKLEFFSKDYDKAAAYIEKAIKIKPDEVLYDMLIKAFCKLSLYANAFHYAEEMLENYPDNIIAVTQMANCYTQMGKTFEAEQLCLDTLQKYPDSPTLWIQLGLLQETIYGNDAQALEFYQKALEVDPAKTTNALYHIAVSYDRLDCFEKAVEYYKKFLDTNLNTPVTHSSLGMAYLRKKMFKEGYEHFFQRDISKFSVEGHCKNLYNIGDKLEDDILIACDQGLGDHLQFIRYLPLIKNKFKSIQVGCLPPLIKLFSENFPDIEFLKYTEIDTKKQAIRICDIPYIFNIDFDNIPSKDQYLDAKPADIKSDKLKIGICWEAGGVALRGPLERTINPKNLAPIFNMENIQLYSLQLEDTFDALKDYPNIINLGKEFKNFSDTASAIKAMDAVICVDTSVLHLAGALGVKTFLLLPYIADWRWFEDTKTTPWYNSVELFKQIDPISWEKPVKDIICRLKELSS